MSTREDIDQIKEKLENAKATTQRLENELEAATSAVKFGDSVVLRAPLLEDAKEEEMFDGRVKRREMTVLALRMMYRETLVVCFWLESENEAEYPSIVKHGVFRRGDLRLLDYDQDIVV